MICGQDMLKFVLLPCFIDACAPLVQVPKSEMTKNSWNCIIKSHQARFHSNKLSLPSQKQNMELKHEGLEDDYFPFQRGVILGYLAVKGVSFTETGTTFQALRKPVMTSPGCQKSR